MYLKKLHVDYSRHFGSQKIHFNNSLMTFSFTLQKWNSWLSNTQHNGTQCRMLSWWCLHMLRVKKYHVLTVIMVNVTMLSAIQLSVVVPWNWAEMIYRLGTDLQKIFISLEFSGLYNLSCCDIILFTIASSSDQLLYLCATWRQNYF